MRLLLYFIDSCHNTRAGASCTLAFCSGAMRQHKTAEQFLHTSMKSFSCSLSANDRLAPSTTSPCWMTWSSLILQGQRQRTQRIRGRVTRESILFTLWHCRDSVWSVTSITTAKMGRRFARTFLPICEAAPHTRCPSAAAAAPGCSLFCESGHRTG